MKNGADGDGSCMDWEGDTSDDTSADDCSEDEVTAGDRTGPTIFLFLLDVCVFVFSSVFFFSIPNRIGSVVSVLQDGTTPYC